jgi:hypothetical protein
VGVVWKYRHGYGYYPLDVDIHLVFAAALKLKPRTQVHTLTLTLTTIDWRVQASYPVRDNMVEVVSLILAFHSHSIHQPHPRSPRPDTHATIIVLVAVIAVATESRLLSAHGHEPRQPSVILLCVLSCAIILEASFRPEESLQHHEL